MFKLGIVGLSRIAVKKVIPSIINESQFSISAVATQSLGSNKLDIGKSLEYYQDYYDILENPDIDGLYVSLPNNMHADYVMKCIQKKQNVLIEKPLCLSCFEASNIIKNYKNNIVIMEGFMYKYHPQWLETIKILRSGSIGKPISATINISYICDDKKNIRYKKKLGGGALYDIGIYCFSMAQLIFQQNPINAFGNQTLCAQTKVDLTNSGTIEFQNGKVSFFASIVHDRQNYVNIKCEYGSVTLHKALNPDLGGMAHITIDNRGKSIELNTPNCNQFKEELFQFKEKCEKREFSLDMNGTLNNIKAVDYFQTNSEKKYVKN